MQNCWNAANHNSAGNVLGTSTVQRDTKEREYTLNINDSKVTAVSRLKTLATDID